MVGVDTATLVGLLTGSILYGVYAVLYAATIYVLLRNRSTSQPTFVLFISSTSLFVLITFIMGVSFSHTLDAFVKHAADPGGALLFLETESDWKTLVPQGVGPLAMVFADTILIYRCWMIWARRWIIVALPLLMLFGSLNTFAFMVVQLALAARFSSSTSTLFNQGLQAFMFLTLAQNLIVTGLIVARLWSINSAPYRNLRSILMPVIWAVVESGALYSATLLVIIIQTFTDISASSIMAAILNSMIGITFSLIIVTVGFNSNKASALSASSTSRPSPPPRRASLRLSQRTGAKDASALPTHRVNASMSNSSDHDGQLEGEEEKYGDDQWTA